MANPFGPPVGSPLVPGESFGNLGIGPDRVMVLETRVYRSQDGQVSRRYVAGDIVDAQEAALLGIGSDLDVLGTVLESPVDEPTDPAGDPSAFPEGLVTTVTVNGEQVEGIVASIDLAPPLDPEPIPDPETAPPVEPSPDPETEAKKAPRTRNKKQADPENKAEQEPENKN